MYRPNEAGQKSKRSPGAREERHFDMRDVH